jgi:hypothetical protein
MGMQTKLVYDDGIGSRANMDFLVQAVAFWEMTGFASFLLLGIDPLVAR